ncbi:ABC transporter permease [Streptomyces sp. Da 82-17]|uniref:ABC transporter permease n=1 Tax=Streptomyces sp. Da 82-17 TaxID=3377116 RepID=UPI0038D42F9E
MTRTTRGGGLDGDPNTGFLHEVRDAVSARTGLLVIGVLLVQLAFIASYIGAFHQPEPHRIPIAVTGPNAQVTAQAVQQLRALPDEPLKPRAVRDEAEALEQIRERGVDGALIVDPRAPGDRLLVASAAGGSLSQALEQVVGAAERAQKRALKVEDVVPGAAGDARGLSSFYLVVGWCVGGYLCASALAISAGAKPANPARALIRLCVMLLYSVVAGLFGALIAGPWLDALPGSVPALWGLGALLVFAVGALTLAFQGIAGVVGIGLAIIVVVVLGNPSAGGAYPYPLLPGFWRGLGPVLPPGAGTFAARSIAYFRGNGAGGPFLVLAAWAVGSAAVTLLLSLLRHDRREATR